MDGKERITEVQSAQKLKKKNEKATWKRRDAQQRQWGAEEKKRRDKERVEKSERWENRVRQKMKKWCSGKIMEGWLDWDRRGRKKGSSMSDEKDRKVKRWRKMKRRTSTVGWRALLCSTLLHKTITSQAPLPPSIYLENKKVERRRKKEREGGRSAGERESVWESERLVVVKRKKKKSSPTQVRAEQKSQTKKRQQGFETFSVSSRWLCSSSS